eukprot:1162020-Pelagomonas_calceolata.AAC.18
MVQVHRLVIKTGSNLCAHQPQQEGVPKLHVHQGIPGLSLPYKVSVLAIEICCCLRVHTTPENRTRAQPRAAAGWCWCIHKQAICLCMVWIFHCAHVHTCRASHGAYMWAGAGASTNRQFACAGFGLSTFNSSSWHCTAKSGSWLELVHPQTGNPFVHSFDFAPNTRSHLQGKP